MAWFQKAISPSSTHHHGMGLEGDQSIINPSSWYWVQKTISPSSTHHHCIGFRKRSAHHQPIIIVLGSENDQPIINPSS